MADHGNSPDATWFPRPHLLLPQVCAGLRRRRSPPHPATEEGGVLLVRRGRRRIHHALTRGLALQLSDFDRRFIINCDASGTEFGVVLHQDNDPIAVYSRAVAPQHAKLAAYERELIELVKAVKHWRPYLWVRPFVIRTDHYSPNYLLDQRISTIPQHTWVSKLFGYNFSIEFNPGKLNTVADALSRRDEEMVTTRAMSSPTFHLFDDFRREADTLLDILIARAKIAAGEAIPEWTVVDDLVLYSGHVFVPVASSLWPRFWPWLTAPATRTSRRCCIAYAPPSFTPRRLGSSVTTSRVARSVSSTKLTTYIPSASSSP